MSSGSHIGHSTTASRMLNAVQPPLGRTRLRTSSDIGMSRSSSFAISSGSPRRAAASSSVMPSSIISENISS